MRVLIQRVSRAQVSVDETVLGSIEQGLLLFIAIENHDTWATLQKMADKVLAYRVFSDPEGKMNLSVKDIKGGVLAISQFTLAADTRKGLRPGFSNAAPPGRAEDLYNQFITLLKQQHKTVATGRFAANMQIELVNDGPVTFMLEL
jgi:D-tyrosyl-tRNA(Tyr) deacylase